MKRGRLVFAILVSVILLTAFVSAFSFGDFFKATGRATDDSSSSSSGGGSGGSGGGGLYYTYLSLDFDQDLDDVVPFGNWKASSSVEEYVEGPLGGEAFRIVEPIYVVNDTGNDERVSFGPGEDFSIALWVKRNSGSNGVAGIMTTSGRGEAVAATEGFSMWFTSSDTPRFMAYDGIIDVGTNNVQVLPEEGWVHLALTVDRSGFARWYKNGIKVGSQEVSLVRDGKIVDQDLKIGIIHTASNTYFLNGSVDDVTLYKGLLSEDKIRELAGECYFEFYSGQIPSVVNLDDLPAYVDDFDLRGSSTACSQKQVEFLIRQGDDEELIDMRAFDNNGRIVKSIEIPGNSQTIVYNVTRPHGYDNIVIKKGSEKETITLDLITENGINKTTIRKYQEDGSTIVICPKKVEGDSCDIGTMTIEIGEVVRGAGAGSLFLSSQEGDVLFSPGFYKGDAEFVVRPVGFDTEEIIESFQFVDGLSEVACQDVYDIASEGESFTGRSGRNYSSSGHGGSGGRGVSSRGTSWSYPSWRNEPGYYLSLKHYKGYNIEEVESELVASPECTTISEYESEKYGVLWACVLKPYSGFYFLDDPTNRKVSSLNYIGLKGEDFYVLEIYSYETVTDEENNQKILKELAKGLSQIADNDYDYQESTRNEYVSTRIELAGVRNDFFYYVFQNNTGEEVSCVSEFEPVLGSSGYYEGRYCQPNWNCKTEPVICPEHGEQEYTCIENSCSDRELVYSDSKQCNPGICSGCLAPRWRYWWYDNLGDNTCIPYGFRFSNLEQDRESLDEAYTEFGTGFSNLTIYNSDRAHWTVSSSSEVDYFFDEDLYVGNRYTFGAGEDFEVEFVVDKIIPDEGQGRVNIRVLEEQNAYCDIDGRIKEQKTKRYDGSWASCQNNYECDSNLCSGGECVEINDAIRNAGAFKSVFVRAVCRIGNLFDEEAYNQCIGEFLGYDSVSS